MATYIRIAGVDIQRLKGSVSVSNTLGGRSTASFVVVDETGVAAYARGQAVEIFTDFPIPPFIHPLFSGFIDYPERQRISPVGNALYWTIQCMDNTYLADKRIAAESYTGQTAGFIVDDLFDKYLAPEGVTIGSIETGPTIAELVVNYSQVSRAFDALAARSDKVWYIDLGKQLWFVDRTTSVAPFAILASDIVRDPGIASRLKEASPFYRNRQYVRAGQNITGLQTETFTGDGVTVAFPLGYPMARVPFVTVTGRGAQTYGIKGIDTAKDVYWNKGDAIITFDVAPAGASTIVCAYYGLYDIIVQVDSVPEQTARAAVEGGTGIIESLEDFPNIEVKADAMDAAIATLNHYGVIGKQFTFPIRDWGLEPGQMVTVTHAPYDLTADELLVESVTISETAPGELKYTVVAIEGPELGDWTGFFKALADARSEIMERITIGSNQILIILSHDSDIWKWSETVTGTPYACDLPSLTLYPSLTRYPC